MDCLPTQVAPVPSECSGRVYPPSLLVCHCAVVCLRVRRRPKEDGGYVLAHRGREVQVKQGFPYSVTTTATRYWYPQQLCMEVAIINTTVFGCMLVCHACQRAQLLRGSQRVRSFVVSSYLLISYSKRTDKSSYPCPVLAFLTTRCKGWQGALPGDAEETSCCDVALGFRI